MTDMTDGTPPDPSRDPRPVALVTGATGGIGRAVVERLVADHRVLALGRDPQALAQLPDGAEAVRADLTDFEALPELVQGLERLDVLVHAAAIGDRMSVESARAEDWRSQLELNVMVPAELTRLALPALRRAQGVVVLINSGAGLTARGGNAVYAASKFALRALADSLRQEVEPDLIRVASVHPGPTDTAMLRGIHDSIGEPYRADEYLRPESVAGAVRAVVDASPDMQLTTVSVRPRQEQSS